MGGEWILGILCPVQELFLLSENIFTVRCQMLQYANPQIFSRKFIQKTVFDKKVSDTFKFHNLPVRTPQEYFVKALPTTEESS